MADASAGSEKKHMPTIKEVINGLYDLNEETAPRWISQGVNSLTPEMLAKAIDEWQDPLLLSQYWCLDSPVVKPFVVMLVLKPYWEPIEQVLKDPNGLYSEISKDPAKKKLLDTTRGKAWLGYVQERTYEYIRYYTWPRKCPCCNSEMERKKVKAANGSYDAYICNSCKCTINAVVSAPPESRLQICKPPDIPGCR